MKNYLLLIDSSRNLSLVSEHSICVHLPAEIIAVISVSERHLPLSEKELSVLLSSFDSILNSNM